MAGPLADPLPEGGTEPVAPGRIAPDFVAVVLSYNASASLARVLRAIAAQTVRPARTIVVDNGSRDGSAAMVRADFPDVLLVALPENVGVGAGHRRGWEVALGSDACEYVWSLEHDSYAEPGCLARLSSEAHRLTASGVRWGVINARAERDLTEATRAALEHEDAALGAVERRRITFNAVVVRRSVIEELGFPREDFFVGHEDFEYSERLRRARYKVMYDEHAIVIHPTKGNRRHGVPTSVLRGFYSMRNAVYVDHAVRKDRGAALRWTALTIASIVSTIVRDDRKLARSCARAVALFDGLSGRLGRRDYWFLRS